jgi:ubiquitin C-terminal hydrolase
MASTVKCSSCDRITIKTDDTQDISLHIEEDASLSLEESIYDFFQPETLEGENAYWCDTCQKPCRATKTLSYTRTPAILIVHLKRLILGKKIQDHIPFDTTLDLEPYMTPGHSLTHDMKLVGIISHQGSKDNGHHTAMTKREDKWTLYNDAITTQTTMKHIHQTQAYILLYRKTEQRVGMGKLAPIDIPKKLESQSRAKGNLNPRLEAQQRRETPVPQPELRTKTPPGQNLPR